MLPSKKIFLGASAVITGVLCQMILPVLLTRILLSATVNPGGGSAAAEAVDQRLEQLHQQTSLGFNAMTLSYLFIITGVIVLLIGIHQNAPAAERLQNNLLPNS